MTKNQKDDIKSLINKHDTLFDGKLRVYPHKKVHLDLKEGARPVHVRSYPVPRVYKPVFKKELDHLIEEGILLPQSSSEWASGMFIAPKKDERV